MASLKSDIILGIDLGTTNSLVAISENGKPHILKDDGGFNLIPSIIYIDQINQSAIVGNEARKFRVSDAKNTAYSVKRFMGRGKADLDQKSLAAIDTSLSTDQNIMIRLGERSFSAVELSAEILKKLKKIAEDNLKTTVSKAVVTVPAYFNDAQRSATRLAGQLAGLDVIRIVNEPTAAALAYGLDKKKNGLIAVYDLGGGTFDISILRLHDGIFEVLATSGDTSLGGDDFDHALAELITNKKSTSPSSELKDKAALIELAESMKKDLSHHLEVRRDQIKVSQAEFNGAISSLVEKTLTITERALSDAKIAKSTVDDIVMVGGSTRVPLVRQKVRAFFGKELNLSLDPDQVVALGAAIQADILSGQNQDLVLLDIVPLSLGIETYGGTIGKIIHRNTKIPAMAQETFTTHVDSQRNVLIHVLQGERELVQDCRSLGKFNLKGLPTMPAGLPKIQVTFLIDANGILTVRAKELATNTESAIEVKPSFGLDDEQIEKMLQASFDNAESDMKSRQLIDTRVQAEGVLKSAEKILREGESLKLEGSQIISDKISVVRKKIEGEDYIAIKDALEELEEAAKPLAALVMNQALKSKLLNQKIDGEKP